MHYTNSYQDSKLGEEIEAIGDELVEAIASIIGSYADRVLAWVANEFEPDEVFTKQELIDWVASNCELTEVFDYSVLDEWCGE